MTVKRTALPAALCLIFGALIGTAVAEPLTTGAGSLPAPSRAPDAEVSPRRVGPVDAPSPNLAPGTIDRSVASGDMPNTSKTVELLLEMQGKNPGLEAGERTKAEIPVARPVTGTAAAGKPAFGSDPTSSFGGAETSLRSKPGAADPQAVDWSAAPPSQFGGVLSSTGGGSREPYRPGSPSGHSADEDDVRWLIPRSVVRFVRENRDMVILGSLAVLVLLWALTAIASKHRK